MVRLVRASNDDILPRNLTALVDKVHHLVLKFCPYRLEVSIDFDLVPVSHDLRSDSEPKHPSCGSMRSAFIEALASEILDRANHAFRVNYTFIIFLI